MNSNRRTQAERSATTRASLIAAGRKLFAERGFADVSTEELVRAAGLTRGALYHQFADKTELFAAVYEAVEADTIRRIATSMAASPAVDPIEAMRVGAQAWLDLCEEPEIHRIALVDAPAVLGWDRWRAIGAQYSLELVQQALRAAIEAGRIAAQPIPPLAHLLLGMVREGALYLATKGAAGNARAQVGDAMDSIINALGRSGPAA